MTNKRGMSRNAETPAADHSYARTPVRRPREIRFSGPGPDGITIQAIEICQSVQAIDNSVTLLAGKTTLVRVYLDQSSVAQTTRLRGELILRQVQSGPARYLPAMNELTLDPAVGASLDDKRQDLSTSLNFLLPPEATSAGPLYVEVNRLSQTGGEDQPMKGRKTVSVNFLAAPPLRIRCVGLRYLDNNTGLMHSPASVHFAYVQSYLARAYPAPLVIWSQIVVDADFSAPFDSNTVVTANMQVAAIRSSEVNAGADPRTHYFGLVDDANGVNFMRGRAMGIPATPQPDTVASGPCGTPNGFAGDNDLSYADWYSAHELGHTFGRFHPGFPPGAQDASDAEFPYDNGQLSSADRKYVGYDLGDSQLGISVRALPGTEYHDVMTYADRQWLSAHTFEAIRIRLASEDAQFAPLIV
jgi:hypothetical protein